MFLLGNKAKIDSLFGLNSCSVFIPGLSKSEGFTIGNYAGKLVRVGNIVVNSQAYKVLLKY